MIYYMGAGVFTGGIDLYTLVFIDDEPWVLRGLEEILPWEDYGFQVVGSFSDAHEALADIRKRAPDAIFTDIRMPKLNGLALLKTLREEGLESEVVIISAHRDFDAALIAIREGVFSYVLKPLDQEEMKALATTLHAKLREKVRVSFDFESPERMAAPAVQGYLAQAARSSHCRICVYDRHIAPPGGGSLVHIESEGACAAALWSYAEKGRPHPTDEMEDADPAGGVGYSRAYPDFTQWQAMYEEAVLALKCGFRYDEHQLTARIQTHLCKNIHENPSLGALARQFYHSESYISGLFKKHTGSTLMGFSQRIRIHAAARDILRTEKGLAQIAQDVGYGDYNYFGRLFKRYMQASPEAYRQTR